MTVSRLSLCLLNRCRGALGPAPFRQSSNLLRCSVAEPSRRFLSSDRANCIDEFPKLPVSAFEFALKTMKKQMALAQWTATNEFSKDDVIELCENAEKVLSFVSECLSTGDFETLKEKFSPEALEKARIIVDKVPTDKRHTLVFTKSFKDMHIFAPWSFIAEDTRILFAFLGIAVLEKQRAWHLTLEIPISGNSISDDFQVSDFNFESESE